MKCQHSPAGNTVLFPGYEEFENSRETGTKQIGRRDAVDIKKRGGIIESPFSIVRRKRTRNLVPESKPWRHSDMQFERGGCG